MCLKATYRWLNKLSSNSITFGSLSAQLGFGNRGIEYIKGVRAFGVFFLCIDHDGLPLREQYENDERKNRGKICGFVA